MIFRSDIGSTSMALLTKDIDVAEVQKLRLLQLSWVDICARLEVSTATIPSGSPLYCLAHASIAHTTISISTLPFLTTINMKKTAKHEATSVWTLTFGKPDGEKNTKHILTFYVAFWRPRNGGVDLRSG